MNLYQLLQLEQPRGNVGIPDAWGCKDITYQLPRPAQEKGIMMLDMVYRLPFLSLDPIIIFSRNGRILHQWEEGYIPGPFEIEKVGKKLARQIDKRG